ncbi:ABC transporter ATP-binding protein [Leucobacter sp. CSA1]|uniref:ABC transporter ATP-binding protein n=1 Tax=Leucobacter chromiisoli TaxID=2796471 RepID=A0A934Q6X7_9MICO|nr:ABC transporter ATP-binding protein [Leucobacter chromiisoli]MBK0417682.1 ABC transporter ATP-binding protein [Leucobacter chromiisoli]
MRNGWKQLRELLPYLPPAAKNYIRFYITIACLLSVLDVAALMLLALSLSSMMQGVSVDLPVIGEIPPDRYVWLLLGVSVLVLLKSFLSLLQNWLATRRFAEYELTLGLRLFDAYIKAPWVDRLSRTTSQLVRMADVGVAAAVGGLILPLMQIPAMLASAVLILGTLVVIQPGTALVVVVYFGLIAWLMARVLTKRAVEAGRVNRDYSFKVASLMTDMVGALKEVTLRDKLDEVAEVVKSNRSHAARARANIQFLATVPRFIMDSALIGGFLFVGVLSFLIEGSMQAAIFSIVLFAVAGMRLVPAMTTFQSTNNTLSANRAQVDAVITDIHAAEKYRAATEQIGKEPLREEPRRISLEGVTFQYPTGDHPAVRDVSLDIRMGSSVGFVGESGSGKSTLVDILLGLLEPQGGVIRVDSQDLTDVMAAWRSRVGYVPQDVSLFDGTIAQNVALSWKGDLDTEKVIECLKKAQLWDVVQARPGGLNARVGERGMAFSGGQRQRLGIARALYTDPYVLILDEATSALDTKTEARVGEAVQGLRGEVTLISVAHRLSTVKDVDELFYMEAGQVIARGTFSEVVDTVPKFLEQARLAGLVEAREDGEF